jgi:hypothetical protein
MSRSGYTDDWDDEPLALGQWRGRVASSIRGKRGQKLLRELRDALDAMPEKRLIEEELVSEDGEVCALGCLGRAKQIPDLDSIDPEDHDCLAKTFDVASCLIQEIEYENDEGGWKETPEKRWDRMRKWCDRHIKPSKEQLK